MKPTGLRLSLALYRVTRNRSYLAQAERTLFNELALNQFATGDYGHRSRGEGEGHVQPGFVAMGGWAQAWWCCLFHGMRAVEEVMRTVFAEEQGATAYLLPVDGRGTSAGVDWVSESRLETDSKVTLRVEKTRGGSSVLRVRVPEWASVEASINGGAVTAAESDWLQLERGWRAGDRVELRYRMRTRAEEYRPPEAFRALAGRVLLWHGPWLLAVDRQASPNFFDEPHDRNQIELPAAGASSLAAGAATSNAFTIPVAHFALNYPAGRLSGATAEGTASSLGRTDRCPLPRPGSSCL